MTTLDDAAERQRFKRIVVECYPRSKGISADEQEALIDIMLVVWRQATEAAAKKCDDLADGNASSMAYVCAAAIRGGG